MKKLLIALLIACPALLLADEMRVKYAVEENAVSVFEATLGPTFSAGRGVTNAVVGQYSIYRTTNAPIKTYMCGDMTIKQLSAVTNFTHAGVAGMVRSLNNPADKVFMDINNNPLYFESLGFVAADPQE